MLISNCCENYICRLCIGWQAKKAKKDENYTIHCSHCYKKEFRLNDVDEDDEAQIKQYTDTPLRFYENRKRKKELGDSQTARIIEINDLTPNGNECVSPKQSEYIPTVREFSKHLIAADGNMMVKIEATERVGHNNGDEQHDPALNLEQLIDHQSDSEI